MKILLVSGFLGAGKTTFIKEMAKNINLEFVVLENEYADIGVDKDFLNDYLAQFQGEFTYSLKFANTYGMSDLYDIGIKSNTKIDKNSIDIGIALFNKRK